MDINKNLSQEIDKEPFSVAEAYWLSPRAVIHPVKMTHIRFILDNPELFKTTKVDLVEIYKKYNEKIGWEGKAREEILTNVMEKGWVRIRDYGNKGWSLQLWELDKFTKGVVWKWAAKLLDYIKENRQVYESNRVTVTLLKNIANKKPNHTWSVDTTFGDIIKGTLEESKTEKLDKEKFVTFKDFKV